MLARFLGFLVLFFLFFHPLYSFAQSPSFEVKQPSVVAKKGNARHETSLRLLNRMLDRFDGGIGRLEKIIGRVDARLEKYAAEGRDVGLVLEQLSATKDKLTLAALALSDLNATIIEWESDDGSVEFSTIKQEVGRIRDEIVGVHTSLHRIVLAMKKIPTKNYAK